MEKNNFKVLQKLNIPISKKKYLYIFNSLISVKVSKNRYPAITLATKQYRKVSLIPLFAILRDNRNQCYFPFCVTTAISVLLRFCATTAISVIRRFCATTAISGIHGFCATTTTAISVIHGFCATTAISVAAYIQTEIAKAFMQLP